MHLSKDGHFLVTTISVGRMFDKLNKWSERMPARLAPWNGSKDAFFKEFTEKYLQNWQNGLAGETGLAGTPAEAIAKKNIFNDFLNLTTKDAAPLNPDRTRTPRRRGDVRGKDIDRTIMSMRLDHIAEMIDNGDAPKVPVSYQKAKLNMMPAEEPASPREEDRKPSPINLGITAAHTTENKPFGAQYVAPKAAPEREITTNEDIQGISKRYVESVGIEHNPHNVAIPVKESLAKKIADYYESHPDSISKPEVKKSYARLAKEVVDQWKAFQEAGYTAEPWTKDGQPYANSKEMMQDVRDNKHIYYFETAKGFGERGITDKMRQENPMLSDSGVDFGSAKNVPVNDVFRVVHDIIGHGANGYEFGPKGEFNAYLEHSRMFSDEAKPALASETLAQNSWVNYGPHLRDKSGNIPKKGQEGYIAPSDRPFAEQKNLAIPKNILDQVDEYAQQQKNVAADGLRFMPSGNQPLDVQFKSDEKEGSLKGKTLNLVHFGAYGIKKTDPRKMGRAYATRTDLRGTYKTYFYVNGTNYEEGISGGSAYLARVDGNSIYDLKKDILGVLANPSREKAEEAIKSAGFAGYYSPKSFSGATFDAVAMFKPVKVTPAEPADIYSKNKLDKIKASPQNVEEAPDYSALDEAWQTVLKKQQEAMKRPSGGVSFMPSRPDDVITKDEVMTPEGVKSMADKGGWAIYTANNPNSQKLSEEKNAKLNIGLMNDIHKSGLEYIPVSGRYGKNDEQGFMVFDPTMTADRASEIAKKYDQESVLTKDGLVYQDGSIAPSRGIIIFDKKPEDDFTTISTPNGDIYFYSDIRFAPKSEEEDYSTSERGFYSGLQKVVSEKMPAKASPQQVLAIVNNPQNAKPEEVKWSNIAGFLEGKQSVTKQEVMDYLKNEGSVKFEERILSGEDEFGAEAIGGSDDATKFGQWTLPNGENYREVMLVHPNAEPWTGFPEGHSYGPVSDPINAQRVAHMRLDERKDSQGRDGLFIEEIQSDRHQQGREQGYATPERDAEIEAERMRLEDAKEEAFKARQRKLTPETDAAFREAADALIHYNNLGKPDRDIPDAPFRKDWPVQMFKRALRDAIDSGKEWIGWTDGNTQAERYDLSKQVDEIRYWPHLTYDKNISVLLNLKGGQQSHELLVNPETGKLVSGIGPSEWSGKSISDVVGKEIADKILSGEGTKASWDKEILNRMKQLPKEYTSLSGLDLKVGGEGMKGFYDQILPKEIGKYVKKWGGKVEQGEIGGTKKNTGDYAWRHTPDGYEVYDRNTGEVVADDIHSSSEAIEYINSLKESYRSSNSHTPIWKIDITPEMRESIQKGGQLAFMPKSEEEPQGIDWNSIKFSADAFAKDPSKALAGIALPQDKKDKNAPTITDDGHVIVKDHQKPFKFTSDVALHFMPATAKVDLEDYLDYPIIALTADRMGIGEVEVGPTGAKQPLSIKTQGGAGFSTLYRDEDNNPVWAFSDLAPATSFMSRINNVADKSGKESVLVAPTLLSSVNHLKNRTGQTAYAEAMEAALKAKMFTKKDLDAHVKEISKRIIEAKDKTKPESVSQKFAAIQSFEQLKKAITQASINFAEATWLMEKAAGKTLPISGKDLDRMGLLPRQIAEQIAHEGFFDLPDFSVVSLFEVPKGQKPEKADFHHAYPYIVRGKSIGYLKNIYNLAQLTSDPRVYKKSGQMTAQPVMVSMPQFDEAKKVLENLSLATKP
jgi:hypothetical protein